MNYGHGATSNRRREQARRRGQPSVDRRKEEKNRRRSLGGGKPNEIGVTQGQNGEQGNTVEPRNARDRGKLAH
jgi:hypothetical protein